MDAVFDTPREGRPEHDVAESAIRELQELRRVLASDPAAVLGDCTDAGLREIMSMIDASVDAYRGCRGVLRFGRGE